MSAFTLLAFANEYDLSLAPAVPATGVIPPPPLPPVVFGTTGRPGGRVILQPKRQSELIGYVVDFISSMAPGETIVTASCIATVYSGNDPSPSFIIDGVATFSGTQVNQGIGNGVVGTIYSLLYTITTSFNQTIQINAYLAVVPNSP